MNTVIAQETEMNVLKSKIAELQSALLYTESASPIKLPTHVVADVEVDDEGRIFFAIPRPMQHIDAFEKEVHARMDFFKKGLDFFVKVNGFAVLLPDEATIDSYATKLSDEMRERMCDERSIGIMMVVHDHQLIDNSPKPKQNWLQSSRSHLSSWFF